MKKPYLKILIVIIFLTSFLILSQLNNKNNSTDTPLVEDDLFGWKYPTVKFPMTGPGELAYSDIRDPGGIPQGLPIRLKIPIIGVDTAIEDALITPDGRMDVPKGSVNVAWFALGPHPGQEGSAVIGGHFGIQNGVKFVFYDLDKLKVGDKIYVVDDKGTTLPFQVRKIQLFERDADATTVFTSNDGKAHLNIITCEGIWNRVNDTYPKRRVVFTDAIPAEITEATPEPFALASTTVFPRPLNMGMMGTDVIALQNFLEQKKLLTMPRGIAKGYYGTLTRIAVAKYQARLGLPTHGSFDSVTIAKAIAETPLTTIKPTLPKTALPPVTKTPANSFIESLKKLYETPLDGLLTTLLLASIVFLAFKIYQNRRHY